MTKPSTIVIAGEDGNKAAMVGCSAAFLGASLTIPGWVLGKLHLWGGERIKVRVLGGRKKLRLEVSRA